jgi:hypothetical protein
LRGTREVREYPFLLLGSIREVGRVMCCSFWMGLFCHVLVYDMAS